MTLNTLFGQNRTETTFDVFLILFPVISKDSVWHEFSILAAVLDFRRKLHPSWEYICTVMIVVLRCVRWQQNKACNSWFQNNSIMYVYLYLMQYFARMYFTCCPQKTIFANFGRY
ncbi:MAG: hypothetical protein A2X46_12580 [Lentisphaerae bacterium GWF2_57_35]|nr:MAG: hypothetical protein A2X46_12580 [Lentisphaerae bacterium GWF2_57_35]